MGEDDAIWGFGGPEAAWFEVVAEFVDERVEVELDASAWGEYFDLVCEAAIEPECATGEGLFGGVGELEGGVFLNNLDVDRAILAKGNWVGAVFGDVARAAGAGCQE